VDHFEGIMEWLAVVAYWLGVLPVFVEAGLLWHSCNYLRISGVVNGLLG